jgi:hypothetical protein
MKVVIIKTRKSIFKKVWNWFEQGCLNIKVEDFNNFII